MLGIMFAISLWISKFAVYITVFTMVLGFRFFLFIARLLWHWYRQRRAYVPPQPIATHQHRKQVFPPMTDLEKILMRPDGKYYMTSGSDWAEEHPDSDGQLKEIAFLRAKSNPLKLDDSKPIPQK